MGGYYSVALTYDGTLPPNIRASSRTQTAEAGTAATLHVLADGAPPLRYQWWFNATAPLSGCTNSWLVFPDVQSGQAGTYTAVVSNLFGTATSTPVTLGVIAPVHKRSLPVINLSGEIGAVLHLSCAEAVGPGAIWQDLDAVILSTTPQPWFDFSTSLPPQRFYRAWQSEPINIVPSISIPGVVPALTLTGSVGDKIRVDGLNQVGPVDAWFNLATVTLTNTTQLYFDTANIGQPPRLYRLVPVP
jgi:hypothetical protein